MSILPIRIYPDPVLREKLPPITEFGMRLRRLAADMIETMIAAPGIGLAAPQVGAPERLAIVDLSVGKDPAQLHVLVNPRLTAASGSMSDEEGCLSLPGITEKVERPTTVTVAAQDLDGNAFVLQADEWLARAICHEIDHLDGILFTDRLRGLRRERAQRQLRKLAAESFAEAKV
jgi:peptide deformylase